MKIKLTIIALLFSLTVSAQKPKWDYITSIEPITWTKEVKSTTTSYQRGNKTSSTVGGAVVGHIVHGGLLGVVAGGLIGNAVGTSDHEVTSTTVSYVKVDGFVINTSKNGSFRTTKFFTKYCVIDMNKITKE